MAEGPAAGAAAPQRDENFGFQPPSMNTYGGGNAAVTRMPLWMLRKRRDMLSKHDVAPAPADLEDDKPQDGDSPERTKFGWVDGVFARVLVQIWGVMLFLRLSWIVGYAGIGQSIGIVILSSIITYITTTSLSAIASNGKVAGGGAYYLISRSLGAEFGGAIGILFFLANAVAIALYLVGFAEALLGQMGTDIVSDTWDLRLVSTAALVVLFILVFVGIEAVIKAQLLLLLTLVLALASFFIGCLLKPGSGNLPASFVGWTANTTGLRNFGPDYSGEADQFPEAAAVLQDEWGTVTFATCLGVFFPAATGIMAGANISGDLKSPATDIPKGTFLGIIVSSSVYILCVIFMGATSLRTVQLPDGTYEGLLHDTLLMARTAIVPWLVYIGIYAATVSSALASLVGAPRILQAVARDKLFSCLGMFAKGVGRNDEPLPAYVLSLVIALVCIAYGDLNAIAPLITNLFMASYSLVNFACLAAELGRSPGWRPSYRGFNKWTALFGTLSCTFMMFFLSWSMGIVTIVLGVVLYYWVSQYSGPEKSWGSAMEGKRYIDALRTLSTLQRTHSHVKNWRPSLLVILGQRPLWSDRMGLVHLARHLKKGRGLSIFASTRCAEYGDAMEQFGTARAWKSKQAQRKLLIRWLGRLRAPGFAEHVVSPTPRLATQALLQLSGVGQLEPNILMMAMDPKWMTRPRAMMNDFVGQIGDAFDNDCGVMVVVGCDAYSRLAMGFSDMAGVDPRVEEEGEGGRIHDVTADSPAPKGRGGRREEASDAALAAIDVEAVAVEEARVGTSTPEVGDQAGAALRRGEPEDTPAADDEESCVSAPSGVGLPTEPNVLRSIESLPDLMRLYGDDDEDDMAGRPAMCCGRPATAEGKGRRIDVYWLDDDGGISVLLPYLVSRHKVWRGVHLRVFVAAASDVDAGRAAAHVKEMLRSFRLPAEVVPVVTTGRPQPTAEEAAAFTSFELEHDEHGEVEVSRRSKVRLQLGALIEEHSKDADLVFVTLPVPRRGTDAALYLAWLWAISRVAQPRFQVQGERGSAAPITLASAYAANHLLAGNVDQAQEVMREVRQAGMGSPPGAAAAGEAADTCQPAATASTEETVWQQLDLSGCALRTKVPVVLIRGNQQTVLTGDS